MNKYQKMHCGITAQKSILMQAKRREK